MPVKLIAREGLGQAVAPSDASGGAFYRSLGISYRSRLTLDCLSISAMVDSDRRQRAFKDRREHIMNKTATVKKAVAQVAMQISDIDSLHKLYQYVSSNGNARLADEYSERIEKEKVRYYHITTAYCFVFDARFEEMERAALDSLGHTTVDNAEQLWESRAK